MWELPFGLTIDADSILLWFNDLYMQCIPDFEALSNEKLSATFALFTQKLLIAASATLTACESWIKLLFYLCRLTIHIILLSYPYIKPLFVKPYNYWNSLDLTVQLSIIAFILSIILSYWIKKNRYIQRTNNYFSAKLRKIKKWFVLKWQKLISFISIRSQMSAKIFPHLIWWFILFSLIWSSPDHVYASHHVLLFIGCFIFPALKTYAIVRTYSDSFKANLPPNPSNSQRSKLQECIETLRVWLEFWCCRAFILFAYSMCCYLLSYIPTFISNSMNEYININPVLFEIICDWVILWLLVIDTSLTFFAKQLTTKIFQVNTNTNSNIAKRDRTEIRSSSSFADKISLSSINYLFQFLLSFIRPFCPTFLYNIIHDGLYQFLIFFIFLFFSAILGCMVLGYLLPIYSSILALENLQELQHKIGLCNGHKSHRIAPKKYKSESNLNLRARKRPSVKNGKTMNKQWSLWSLVPLNVFSFGSNDDFDMDERKREQLQHEANHVIESIVDRLKYWIVFACVEWIYYFIGQQMGLQHYVPAWNYIKFVLILWIQLPYVPYSANIMYEYCILPFRILDINHIENEDKKNEEKKNEDDEGDEGDEGDNGIIERKHNEHTVTDDESVLFIT